MLARVAESLYWIGRDIERSEHCSRYLKVQFFSTLDAPMSQNKDFTLRSILFMSGSDFNTDSPLAAKEVWQKVIFDSNNSSSLNSIAQNARENARSIRNSISTELWESINKWFLFSKSMDAESFNSSKIFSYTEQMNTHIALVKSNIYNTLLHNDIWNFICLGIYVERSLQVLRILRSKISDSIILSNNGANYPLLQYQWTTLLKSLESFDVHKGQYKGHLSKETIFELILTNEKFPRSLKYSLNKVLLHLTKISIKPASFDDVFSQFETEIKECTVFENSSDEDEVINSIAEIHDCISNFHFKIEKLYFQ